jgi:hypothetical protein
MCHYSPVMPLSDAVEPRRSLLTAYRLVIALVIFAALVTEISTLVERGRLEPGNLFSYFTIEANAFAVAVLLISIGWGGSSRALVMLRGAATLYMAVTGIVFSLLLAGIEGAEFTAVPWDNTVLHFLGPIAVVLDWFLDLPRARIAYGGAMVWLVYPLAYGAYSLIRGAIVDWYPYPFLDPDRHGYPSIAATMLGLTLFGAVLTWILVVLTGRQGAPHSP